MADHERENWSKEPTNGRTKRASANDKPGSTLTNKGNTRKSTIERRDSKFVPRSRIDLESSSVSVPRRLSRMERDVRDFLIESALIHFEPEFAPYQLCVDHVSDQFGLSLEQAVLVVQRLIDSGFAETEPKTIDQQAQLRATTFIFPTLAAMRCVDLLEVISDSVLLEELQHLHECAADLDN